jgi:hypothetical protein
LLRCGLDWSLTLMTTAAAPSEPTLDPDRTRADDPTPLRAVHSPNFPALLRQLDASLLVTGAFVKV